jgi:HSP20 family protein
LAPLIVWDEGNETQGQKLETRNERRNIMNTHYNPLAAWRDSWSPISELRREFDRLFDDWAPTTSQRGLQAAGEGSFMPACDVEEADGHYLLALEMPGMKKEDIKIEALDNQLVVSGERRTETRQGKNGSLYSERRFGRFQRSFALPAGVDLDRVEANYQDGVLRLMVPKAESAKPRQIKITGGTGASAAGGGFFSKLIPQAKDSRESKDKDKDATEYKTVAS